MRIYFVSLILFATVICCQYMDDNQESVNSTETAFGKISGLDDRVCNCCGGYVIEIDNQVFRFNISDLPENNLVLDMENFPIDVIVDWRSNTKNQCRDSILITSIEQL